MNSYSLSYFLVKPLVSKTKRFVVLSSWLISYTVVQLVLLWSRVAHRMLLSLRGWVSFLQVFYNFLSKKKKKVLPDLFPFL